MAQPDAVATPENVIGTGSLFANNGSGPDTDADGDTITDHDGQRRRPPTVGNQIILASGAKLTVNSDGTYSYNPNGKFNRLDRRQRRARSTPRRSATRSPTR